MRIAGWLLLILAAVAGTGCRKSETVWTGTCNFSSSTWKGSEAVTFEPDSISLQTADAAMAIITLRYGAGASAVSFPIVVETECGGEGTFSTDTIRCLLLETEKRTANKARLGIFEKNDTLKLSSEPGPGWQMCLRLPDFEDEIRGLYSITLTLVKE